MAEVAMAGHVNAVGPGHGRQLFLPPGSDARRTPPPTPCQRIVSDGEIAPRRNRPRSPGAREARMAGNWQMVMNRR